MISFNKKNNTHSELYNILKLFRNELFIVAALSLVANLLMLAPTFYQLQVYDRVLISQNEVTLIVLTIIIVFLFGVLSVSEWLRTKILVRVGIRFNELMGRRVFRATYEEKLKASPMNAMEPINDMNNIRTFITGSGILAFFDIPWSPVYVYVCYLLHPILGITALFFALILFSMTILSQRLMKGKVEVAMSERLHENVLIQAKLKNPELVESMGMVSKLFRVWMLRHAKSVHAQDQSSLVSYDLTAASKFIRQAQASLVLAIGAWLVAIDELRPSAMIAANLLVARGVQPIDLVVSTWEQFFSAKVSYERLNKLFEDNPVKKTKFIPLPPSGAVICENLFAYADGRDDPILKNISVKFKVGDVVAIMGPSGSGKTTLSRCIMGVWPKVEGKVLLDGYEITDYDRQELGPHIGYLPQSIELFYGSVAQNIARFGELDNEAIIEAAQVAGIHQAILALPQGYDTLIGYAGGFLSGGQRQRLGLARAIYGNPQIILLDEPNSNLDHEGEQFLFKAIEVMKSRGKTIFVVAHTQNFLPIVDKVLLIMNGQVEAFGNKEIAIPLLTGQGK